MLDPLVGSYQISEQRKRVADTTERHASRLKRSVETKSRVIWASVTTESNVKRCKVSWPP